MYKVPCANCDKTYVGETEKSLESGYKNTGQKLRQKLHGRLQKSHRVSSLSEQLPFLINLSWVENTTNPPSPTTRLKRTIWSTGPKQWLSTGSRCDFPGGSKRHWGSTYPQERSTQHAMNRDACMQLSTQSRLRPLSWHGIFQSCQEPEELSTIFFWWRPLIEVETSIVCN